MPERQEPELAPADAPTIKRGDMTEYTYPGKLTKCAKVLSDRPFGDPPAKATQWYLVFERADRKWSDGNPVEARSRLTLVWGNGDIVKKGSDADLVAENNEQVFGNSLLPDEGGPQFIGHYFMLRDVESRSSIRKRTDPTAKNYDADARPFFLTMVAEHIGESYEYTGNVRVVQSKQAGQNASGPTSNPEEDKKVAKQVAAALAGSTEEDVRGGAGIALIAQENVEAQSLFGLTLKGGLYGPSKAPLLDKLITEGFLTVEDGVLKEAE